MKGKKGFVDEGGVRSPFCIRWEGTLEAGTKVSEIAGTIDLLPTLTDLAGIDYRPEKPLDGISLKPLLAGGDPSWEDRFIFSRYRDSISVRSKQYRLDYEDHLYDILNDLGQTTDIAAEKPDLQKQFIDAREKWEMDVWGELPETDERPFLICHPDFEFTQIPARDGTATGKIERSNFYPNCSFYTNWTSTDEYINWEAEVMEEGDYEVEVYYTCPPEDIGSTLELSFNQTEITATLSKAHDPPLTGMEYDRYPRKVSYIKDFVPLKMGTIHLVKGKGTLVLKAIDMPGSQVMDFRLMTFKRVTLEG